MAFKLDFSKIDPSHRRAPTCPYALGDRDIFRDKQGQPRKIRRGVVDVDLDDRRHPNMGLDDVSFRARAQREDGSEQEIMLVFKGPRARDLKQSRLMADFQAAHEARCDANDWDSHIERRLIVEGAWVPRNWKDREGTWHKSWELIVAKYHYTPDGEPSFVIEGRDPVLG